MSRSSIGLVVVGIALVGLLFALQQLALSGPHSIEAEVVRNDDAGIEAASNREASPAAPMAKSRDIGTAPVIKTNSGSEQRSEPSAAIGAGTVLPATTALKETSSSEGTGSANPGSSEAEVDPRAVVGRHFPMAASLAAGCKVDGCPELDEALAKFSLEPRDLAWAANVETKLRDFVGAHSDRYMIRTVECRTSLCVMEVT